MSKQANPTIIGIFVLGALLIAVLGVTIFSSGKWLTDKSEFVVYFNESVNGLSIGALVKMQGVPIGKVTDIQVQLHPETQRILTPVFIEIDHTKCEQLLQFKTLSNKQEMMEQLIENGLRMQLQYTSLVTGQLYIESLLKPESTAYLTHLNKEYAELPTIISKSVEVQKSIVDVMQEFRSIPLQELFAELVLTVRNIKEITGSDDINQAVKGFSKSLDELQGILAAFKPYANNIARNTDKTLLHSGHLMQKLDASAEPLLSDAKQTLISANLTLQQVQSTALHVEKLFSEDAQLQQNFNGTLKELRRSAKSLRLLADYLEQHPEALIQGKRY